MDITVNEFKKIMHDVNIIDIRSHDKYILGTILNAKNISVNELLFHYDGYLEKGVDYYIFCDNGVSSKKLSVLLAKLGYSVYNIIGGYSKFVLD